MRLPRLGHQHVFQGLPFLGDLEVAVTVLALEIVVQVDQVLIQARVGQGEFSDRISTSPGIIASRIRLSSPSRSSMGMNWSA